jgi:hypothetical protein
MITVVVVCIAGCGNSVQESKGKSNANKTKDQKDKPDLPTSLNVGKGQITVTDPDTKKPQWNMKWKSATVDVEDMDEGGSATAKGVSGDIMRDGKIAASYKADAGVGNRAKETLSLQGNVRIASKSYQATLSCREVLYDAKLKILKAKGGVTVDGEGGTIVTDELWAAPDLSVVGTPDLYNKS